MAHKQEQAPRGKRLRALAAVGFLAVATALAFGRVFLGPAPTWKLVAAALASAGVATLFERRSLLAATLASAATLLVAVGLLVFPQTTLGGLPTRETLRAIGQALGQVTEQSRVQAAPTAPLSPLLLAAITAVWTATFSAHALAVRAGSPVLAALPPVALLAFADTVMDDGARPIYATLFLGGVLAVVFADGLRRVDQWGPVWPWPGHGRRTWATRGARRVALLAVGIAAAVPGILPGFGSGPLFDLNGRSGDRIQIDPLVSIRAELRRQQPVDLFEVTASRPDYWRMLALDQFDGTTWTTDDLQVSNGRTLKTPATLTTDSAPGAQTLEQSYRVLDDVSFPWVPMAYPPVSIDLAGGTIRYDDNLVSAVTLSGLSAGDRYSVTSRLVIPTPAQLDNVVFGTPAQYGRYTELPGDTPRKIFDIAKRWAGDPSLPAFRRILAIQDHLLSFTYSIDVKPRADSQTLVDFLTVTKRGFCQQFASAMAVLVRALGYPARVAVGFRPGTYDATTGAYRVSTQDAHSWVEVLFPGYGWLAFEPTPTRTNPVAQPYLAPSSTEGCAPGPCTGRGENQLGRGAGGLLSGQLTNFERSGGRGGRGAHVAGSFVVPRSIPIPYGLLIRALLAVAGALALVIPAGKWLSRRLHLRSANQPRGIVLATFQVFAGRAADLGLGRRDGETLAEYRRRLEADVRFSDGHLSRLTDIAARAAYSPRAPSDEEVREAAGAARTAIRDMRRDRGVVRRVAGIYRLRL